MSLPRLPSVVVTLAAPGATAADDREALLAAVAAAAAVDVVGRRDGREQRLPVDVPGRARGDERQDDVREARETHVVSLRSTVRAVRSTRA